MKEEFHNRCVDIAIEALGKEQHVVAVSKDLCKTESLSLTSRVFKSTMDLKGENGQIQEVESFIIFPSDFPYSFPLFQLGKRDFKQFYPIPHLDHDRHLCTFLRSETDLDEDKPIEILQDCYYQAVKTLERGIQGDNVEEFQDEYLVYWRDGNGMVTQILSLVENPESVIKRLLRTSKAIGGYYLFLLDDNEGSKNFISNLKRMNIPYSDVDFVLDLEFKPKDYPPFELSVGEYIQQLGARIKTLKLKINQGCRDILCKKVVNGETQVFCYRLPIVKIPSKGSFRPYRYSKFKALKNFHSHQLLDRSHAKPFTRKRMSRRTSGDESEKIINISIAGLGSIGSNLIPFLDSLNHPNFILIDPEYLEVENVGRHYCGLTSVGDYKVNAVEKRLIEKSPIRRISAVASNVSNALKKNLDSINESNVLIVAIGIPSVERYLVESIKNEEVKTPCIFIWVEPYLAAGHVLFLSPSDAEYYQKVHSEGLFQYNVINQSAYKDPSQNLKLSDAGCGSNYVPYSYADMLEFLGGSWARIRNLINKPPQKSKSFSWVGDLPRLQQMGIPLSVFGERCIENKERLNHHQ